MGWEIICPLLFLLRDDLLRLAVEPILAALLGLI
jgi:hypothetical protein